MRTLIMFGKDEFGQKRTATYILLKQLYAYQKNTFFKDTVELLNNILS